MPEGNTIYEVQPVINFFERASVLVDADSEEEAIARAERAVIHCEGKVHQSAFNDLQKRQFDQGPKGELEGDSLIFDYGPEADVPSRHKDQILKAEDDELERATDRGENEWTVIGYDEEKSARIRMGVYGETPEEAIREFFRQFSEENYAPAVTFDFDQPLGRLEEAMNVIIVSCHEGSSTERVQEAITYA
jgi:hypothetical protein